MAVDKMQPVQCTLAGRQPLCLSPNSHIQCCSSRGVCAGLHGMGLHRGRARSLLAAHSTPGPSAKDLVGSQAAVPAQPTSVLGREEWMNEHTGRAGSQASEASSHSPMPAELLGIKRHQGTNRSLRRRLINGLMLACVVRAFCILS